MTEYTKSKMFCENCGNPEVKLIPPGISKKTGKPYGAFLSCNSCGKTKSLEPKPKAGSILHPSPKNPANESLEAINATLQDILNEMDVLRGDVRMIREDLNRRP